MSYILSSRKAIESLYDRTCDVIEYKTTVNPINKRTGNKTEETVIEGQPCRLSYQSISNTNQSNPTNNVSQVIKLILAPEIEIKEGSKIVVTKGELVETYKNSGKPAVYDTHQEIILVNFEGWA